MKKVLSIVFAFLILFSGLQLRLSTHFCKGELVASKLTFSGEKASCGMETTHDTCSLHNISKTNCCLDKIFTFVVDDNYNISNTQIKIFTFAQLFSIPSYFVYNAEPTINYLHNKFFPPGIGNANSMVSLTEICVFRI